MLHSIKAPTPFIARPELQILLSYARENASNNPLIVLRSGDAVPGGTGKTTLARAVAAQLRADGLFAGHHLMLALNGAEHHKLDERTKAVRLAKEVVIESCSGVDRSELSKLNDEELNRSYKQALTTKVGLLLIDDAWSEVEVRSLLLLNDSSVSTTSSTSSTSTTSSSFRSICAIITTRNDIVLAGARLFDVGKLSDDDSVKILQSFEQNRNIRVDDLKKVAVKCGNVALALSIVGASMARHKTFSVQKMLDSFVSKDVANGMQSSLQWSFDALDSKLQDVLQRASMFPFSFSVNAFDGAFTVDAHEDLQSLLHHGWLTWNRNEERFAMHDVVRDFVRKTIDSNRQVQLSDLIRKHFVRK